MSNLFFFISTRNNARLTYKSVIDEAVVCMLGHNCVLDKTLKETIINLKKVITTLPLSMLAFELRPALCWFSQVPLLIKTCQMGSDRSPESKV